MDVERAKFVRWVGADERPGDLVNEAKALTWESNAEHSLVELATGGLALVRGGRKGIAFEVRGEGSDRKLLVEVSGELVRVVRPAWHTHPMGTGPSDDDINVLAILGQADSFIFEIGGGDDGTRIRPKAGAGDA